ncbi:multidrug transporter [Tenacibaculum holothuriorum]|uniref:Multidrug transporter n=1 Tax=Tenacibaculum holothuriorum TaxID=1635173 RepID=A0A1Y2PGA9_9FLAO|nr:DMT family transporter [Tenacibaculum holothuriorum]OSY89041.1 multidrug transporter [Tenacibaculum holothuriorum]
MEKQNSHTKHLSQLVLATLFISTSGVLGKYIKLSPEVIVWFRAAIAMMFLFGFCKVKNISLKVKSQKDRFTFIIAGVFMALHWVTYFYALKLSNVAVGMLSLYTYPVITTFLEPFFFKNKLSKVHLLLGAMVLLGVYILAPEMHLESSMIQGIAFGVFSAFCYAIRFLLMKKLVVQYHGSMLMFYQMLIVAFVTIPYLFLKDISNISHQYPYVLILGILTTAIGHTLLTLKLKHFKASTASIISSIQPVFGIVLAFLFLNEVPKLQTFFGGLLILSTVIIESIRSKKSKA